MKKIILLISISLNLFANNILTKIDNDIKIETWSDNSGFFNPNNTFNEKDKNKFNICLLQKNEKDNLVLCIEQQSNKTYGAIINGSFVDDNTFIPENNFITVKEMIVKIN